MIKNIFLSTYSHLIKINLFLFFLILGCSSSDSASSNTPMVITPSNLVINTEIVGANAVNINGDGSGVVNFNLSAINATSYSVLVDGQTINSTTGIFSYTFTGSGTTTYTILASAYNGGQFVSGSKTITVFVGSNLLWSDEFNTDGAPNTSSWSYDIGAGGWGNNEEQYYTNRPENVIVQGGLLKIKTIKESYLGSAYTSARILTKGKFSFKYGKVDIYAKLPSGGGTWPALWMLGDNISTAGWPACGEIDIMEHIGNQLGKIHGTLHHPGHSGGNGDTSTVDITNVTTQFHLYTIDWRASYIKFYVDNVLFYTFSNSSSLPFNQNFFLIFNNAMGGNFGNVGGGIDPNFTASTFEVDYVRVYN